jgi:hypothetical protein
MKKLILFLFLGLSLFASTSFSHAFPGLHVSEKIETTVYITKTGAKYHNASCRYLRQSKIEIAKKKAIAQGYEACKVCKP